MQLSPITKQDIAEVFGKKIRYPADYENLALDIELKTKQRISTNTIKRLYGKIKSAQTPRLSTLDIIANYLNYENWDKYVLSLQNRGNSSFIAPYHSIYDRNRGYDKIITSQLPLNTKISFSYYPGRIVRVLYTGNKLFKVIFSINSKLIVDDIIEVSSFMLDYPLIIDNIYRNGTNLGGFVAGQHHGLEKLYILDETK